MEEKSKASARLDADSFVRQWNLYFNRTIAYSLDHPAVLEMLPRVYASLQKLLDPAGSISILLQELGYYIGQLDIAYQPNNRKIADHLRRFGIDSITFSSPLHQEDLAHILEATALTHADATSFLRFLGSRGVHNIAVNNVTLQTVKEGEAVMAAGSESGGGRSSSSLKNAFEDVTLRVVLGHITAQEMSTNLSVLQMLHAPAAGGSSLPQAVAQVSASAPPESQENALRQALLNSLGMFSGSAQSGDTSIEDLLAGMYNMRGELLKALRAQEGLVRHLQQEDRLPDSAEALFENTAADLIVQEYRKHPGNPRKVADIIQRIVPEKRQLQGVLAKVRAALTQAGAPLIEYYNLLNELNIRLTADQGYQDFLRASTSVGVSAQELVQTLQQNPKQAAQLIVLAGELQRQGKGGKADDLVLGLADLVESAGEEIARQAEESPRESGRLAGMLFQLESEVGRELEGQTLSEEAKAAARQRLHLRLQRSLGDVKRRATLTQLRNPNLTETERMEFLLQTFADEKELDEVLGFIGAQDSVAEQVAQELLAKARQEMKARRERHLSKDLPNGVYVKAVLDFFLKFEVSRSLRYHLPFSAVLVSFQGLPEDKESQEKYGEALHGLQNVLVGDLRALFRDSDFVGYLGFNRFLLVAPMTAAEATSAIVKKIRDNLTRQAALPDGTRAWLRPRCGCASFDTEHVNTHQKLYQELQKSWKADA